jgi:hypothetical protein
MRWVADHERDVLELRPLPAALMLSRVLAYVGPNGPWLLRDGLRAALVVILGAVSSYYLTRWALANAWPTPLAWALPVALDLAALLGIVIVRHAASDDARKAALRLAWGAGGLSVLGNSAMHALDFGAIHVTLWTVIATLPVVPAMIVWGWHVAGGMVQRPSAIAARKPAKARGGRPTGKGNDEVRAAAGLRAAPPTLSSPPPTTPSEPVEWAHREVLAGRSAGWRRILNNHPDLTEHGAKQIAQLVKASPPAHTTNGHKVLA